MLSGEVIPRISFFGLGVRNAILEISIKMSSSIDFAAIHFSLFPFSVLRGVF